VTLINTPDDIITQLVAIREQAERGIALLYEAEVKSAKLQLEADKVEATALITAEGNVAHKQAIAKIKSGEARLEADIAKAEYQRIRTKLRHLELAQSSLQTQAKMVEITWRTAGVGER
jgi:lipopolysaccharide export system protein LptA